MGNCNFYNSSKNTWSSEVENHGRPIVIFQALYLAFVACSHIYGFLKVRDGMPSRLLF